MLSGPGADDEENLDRAVVSSLLMSGGAER